MKNYKDKKQKFFLFKNQKKLKKTILTAQNSWMANKIEGLGQGNKHPKEYRDWNCVNNIKL